MTLKLETHINVVCTLHVYIDCDKYKFNFLDNIFVFYLFGHDFFNSKKCEFIVILMRRFCKKELY